MCILGVHPRFQGYTASQRLSPGQHNALPGYIRQPWPSPCSLWAQSYFPPQWTEIWPCSIAVLFTLLIIFWATQCLLFDNGPFVCLNFYFVIAPNGVGVPTGWSPEHLLAKPWCDPMKRASFMYVWVLLACAFGVASSRSLFIPMLWRFPLLFYS